MKKILLLFSLTLFVYACSDNDSDEQLGLKKEEAIMVDIDGNAYPTVIINRPDNPVSANTSSIGQQIWTVRNLEVSRYRNGDPIPQVTDPVQWAQLTTGAWCYYNNDPANGPIYGKLYNWYAVNDPRGLAPTGYHIPSETEWTTLINFLGGPEFAGGKMKANTLWTTPNVGVTNNSAFKGLPAGYRFSNFQEKGYVGFWWSSTAPELSYAEQVFVVYMFSNAYRGARDKSNGLSVRCIKN